MIVKDEAKNIERCLASVKDVVDCYVIDDTGSTDGTPDLIKKVMDKYKIPGKIYYTPWQDFGYNREQALQHVNGDADYAMFIDADEELKYNDASIFTNLTADSYIIYKEDYGRSFRHAGLVKVNSCGWHWHGAVHNEIIPDSQPVEKILLGACIVHHGGGAKKRGLTFPEAGAKEAAILEAELKKDPTNARNQYYLGQAYRNAREWQKSYDAYVRRISMGGWEEEVFQAILQASFLKWTITQEFPAGHFLSAYQFMPTRAEGLYHLVRYYRKQEAYNLAYMFAKIGVKIPYPEGAMTVIEDVYEWKMLYELATAACKTKRYGEAVELCDRLLSEGKLPKADVKRVKANRKIASKLNKVAVVKGA